MMPAGSFSKRLRRRIALVPLLVGAGVAALPAAADTLADVQRLYYGGQVAEAMRRADEGLAAQAADPPLLFMKGVMLADAKREAEAIAVFEQLTDAYPDLAEPYNNLAALYGAGGQYDKARVALEQALRVNPGYAIAWENLGDVYVALASQAYGKTVRLDRTNTGAAAKLEAARRVYKRTGAAPPSTPATGPAAALPSPTGSIAPTPKP